MVFICYNSSRRSCQETLEEAWKDFASPTHTLVSLCITLHRTMTEPPLASLLGFCISILLVVLYKLLLLMLVPFRMLTLCQLYVVVSESNDNVMSFRTKFVVLILGKSSRSICSRQSGELVY